MADQAPHELPAISLTFPNPPDFLWRDFTPDKVARFQELQKKWQEANPAAASLKAVTRIPDLPEDLMHIQPPPEPADGSWRLFGGLYKLKDELPTLEEQGIARLLPSGSPTASANHFTTAMTTDSNRERALNLKRLAKSVLLNFLEFVGAASINPDAILDKANDIQTILINIHHGINEYRPHQARESLIQKMQDRLDQIHAETQQVNAVTDKAKAVLEGLGSIEISGPDYTTRNPEVMVEDGVKVAYLPDDEEVWDEAVELA